MIEDDDTSAYPSEGGETRARVYGRAERGVQGGQRGAVSREIIDEVTGEMLDVIQDNDPDLPPEPDLQESDGSPPDYAARASTLGGWISGPGRGDFVEVQAAFDDIRVGDFVTVECLHEDTRLVARQVTILELEPAR